MRLPRIKIPIDTEWLGFMIMLGITVGIRGLLKNWVWWNNQNVQGITTGMEFLIVAIIVLFCAYKGLKYIKTMIINLTKSKSRIRKLLLASYIVIIAFSLINEASLSVIFGLTFILGAIYLSFFKGDLS